MSSNLKLKEIVFCNLTIAHKKKIYELKEVVYKNINGMFYKKNLLSKLNISEPCKVIRVEIISRLGFENKAKGFTEVKANDEKRNKITGTYE